MGLSEWTSVEPMTALRVYNKVIPEGTSSYNPKNPMIKRTGRDSYRMRDGDEEIAISLSSDATELKELMPDV